MSGAQEDRRLAPVDGNTQSITVGTAATAATALTTAASASPGYITCEAVGGDIAVVFGTSTCGAPALSGTSKNSETIPAGQTRDYWITPAETHFRAIATVAACTLAMRRSSP
jgi:hypothetical protein